MDLIVQYIVWAVSTPGPAQSHFLDLVGENIDKGVLIVHITLYNKMHLKDLDAERSVLRALKRSVLN